jgi:hypothetical protein
MAGFDLIDHMRDDAMNATTDGASDANAELAGGAAAVDTLLDGVRAR